MNHRRLLPGLLLLLAASWFVWRMALPYLLAIRTGVMYDASLYRLHRFTPPSVVNPTVLRFGPDGALYVATRAGMIHRLPVRSDGGRLSLGEGEAIGLVAELPNHNDHGEPEPRVRGRLITGLAVAGSAAAPVLYVSSSDPRIERPEIDTNSGILSRLTRAGSRWRRDDLVRGLPRSRYDHAPNGVALSLDGRTLYLSTGAMTNMGAASAPFLHLREYPLAGAVLAIDLERTGAAPFDLPTRGEKRVPGGEGGANAALLPADGPVRLYAEGLRNAYSLLMTPVGLFTIDNGSNAGFGGPPRADNPNAEVEGGVQALNPLYWIHTGGLNFGQANPARPRPARPPEAALRTFESSTNGLALSSYSSASGRLELVAVSLDGVLYKLGVDTRARRFLGRRALAVNLGGMPLDVAIAHSGAGLGAASPGCLWIADMGGSALFALEPLQDAALRSAVWRREPIRTLATRALLRWMPVRLDLEAWYAGEPSRGAAPPRER